MPLYLGFDSSTQGLTATIVEIDGRRRRLVAEHTLLFDTAFPEFGTRHGVLPSADPSVATAPPLMWAAALDRMAATIAESGLDLTAIRAISGSAQQHGSVYLGQSASGALASLDPGQALAPQIAPILTRASSPVWLDCSTTSACREITAALGGDEAVAGLTGSRVVERFTAAQVRTFALGDEPAYARTDRIHLVSSFLASLLLGAHAPLEPADASGMNLMDLAQSRWAPRALDATAPDLGWRLPPISPSWTIAGRLDRYWQRRHGFPAARVIAWSGDNPSSLVGLGLVDPSQRAISLGTSDTVFGPVDQPTSCEGELGHVFASPMGGYMALTCFANGSLARESVRDAYGLDWDGVSTLLRTTPAANSGALMLPWFVPEITPHVARAGVRRQGLDVADAARNVRAVIEAQALAMRQHSDWMGGRVRTIHATGGAAANADILQVIADVFDADVYRPRRRNAASLGAALRAFQADQLADGRPVSWQEATAGFAEKEHEHSVSPIPANVAEYVRMRERYAAFERDALRADETGSRISR